MNNVQNNSVAVPLKPTDEATSIEPITNMRQFLSEWAIEYNITQNALNSLMAGLKQRGVSDIPQDARTLLKTSKNANAVSMGDGTYCHIGIEKCILAYLITLTNHNFSIPNKFTLDFNIDEVSVSKSTQSVMWLIQMGLRGIDCNPFVIGVFQGEHKPDCNEFLRQFVDDINALIINKIKYNNEFIDIELGHFCCDTPAVSFIRGSKGHTGFSCCVKCKQRGIYLDSCMVFPQVTIEDRNDEDFRERMDPEHHVKDSILETIHGIDMVRCFPVDEMHIVHLGVTKKLVSFWIKIFNKNQINAVNDRTNIVEKLRPFEIRREIRLLSDVGRFKAKEFRTFLLFTGPVILKDILDTKYYRHFLLLHYAMRKLSLKNCLDDIQSIQQLLVEFVKEFRTLYGLNKGTYVVHSLIHICRDVQHFNLCPHKFSAYNYENNNGKIVKNIRLKRNIAQQIHNRAVENLKNISITNRNQSIQLQRKSVTNGHIFFERMIVKGYRLDKSDRNKWFLTKNNEICSFDHAKVVNGSFIVSCKKISSDLKSSYDYPYSSMNLNIFSVDENYTFTEFEIDSNLIQCKMFALTSNGLAFFPISNDILY